MGGTGTGTPISGLVSGGTGTPVAALGGALKVDILDVSDALTEWERPTIIKTVTETTVNFQPVEAVTSRIQNCVVQVAEKEKLNPATIDWSLEYIMVHSRKGIEMDELIEDEGRDFIVIDRGPWRGYGYTESIAVETKRPMVMVT